MVGSDELQENPVPRLAGVVRGRGKINPAARFAFDAFREGGTVPAVANHLHIDASPGAIAPTVLLPGDPLRARSLSEGLLDAPRQVAGRRNMLGFTGRWNGQPVSIVGSGMGIPSCAIYATELFRSFGVTRIVRVGTCAAVGTHPLGAVLLATSASTDSSFNRHRFGGHDLAATADFDLLSTLATGARRAGVSLTAAPVFSTDAFHDGAPELAGLLATHGIAGVEMESAGLYAVAMRERVAAASVLVVSDRLDSPEQMSGEDRERGMLDVGRWVLDSLLPRG